MTFPPSILQHYFLRTRTRFIFTFKTLNSDAELLRPNSGTPSFTPPDHARTCWPPQSPWLSRGSVLQLWESSQVAGARNPATQPRPTHGCSCPLLGLNLRASPVQLGSQYFHLRKADPGRKRMSCLRHQATSGERFFYRKLLCFFTVSLPIFFFLKKTKSHSADVLCLNGWKCLFKSPAKKF